MYITLYIVLLTHLLVLYQIYNHFAFELGEYKSDIYCILPWQLFDVISSTYRTCQNKCISCNVYSIVDRSLSDLSDLLDLSSCIAALEFVSCIYATTNIFNLGRSDKSDRSRPVNHTINTI